jgi:hypothetical protein
MKLILTATMSVLVCAASSHAALLSSLQLQATSPDPTPTIGFTIAETFGNGYSFMFEAQPGVNYYADQQTLTGMYAYASNPHAYEQHGPVTVTMNVGDWVTDVWHTFWSGYVTVIAEPNYTNGATINGTPAVLTTPWQGLSMQWTGSQLNVNIYDTPVPEPNVLLLGMCGMIFQLLRIRR